MVDFLWWILIMTGATGLALKILGIRRIAFQNGVEEIVFSCALALGGLSYLVFIVGSFRGLYPVFFAAIVSFTALCFYGPFCIRVWALVRRALSYFKESTPWEKTAFFIVCAVFFFSVQGALAPATGQDELCYHLTQPKNYVRANAVYAAPFSANSLWPYFMEMLFTLGLLLSGDGLAKLFHFSTYFLTGLALMAFLLRFGSRPRAFLGACLYWLTPAAFIQAAFAYVDNALALYSFLAAYSLAVFLKEKKRQWVVFAGVFAGFAIATKFIGLFLLPAAFLTLLLHGIRTKERKEMLLSAGIFGAALFLCGGVWYLRSWVLRGNPVFPFASGIFGGNGWADPTYVGVHGRGTDLGSFLRLPWDLTMHPELFGGEHIGPMYLVLLPLFFLSLPVPGGILFVALFALLFLIQWFFTDPNVRFFFPVLAFACAGGAYALGVLWDGKRGILRAVFRSAVIVLFAIQGAFAVHHFADDVWVNWGGDREAFIARRERTYDAAKIINKALKDTDRILSVGGEVKIFYFNNFVALDADFARMTLYKEKTESVAELRDYLKSLGFTHVLLSKTEEVFADPYPLSLARVLEHPKTCAEYFKEELVVTSHGLTYELYRIL